MPPDWWRERARHWHFTSHLAAGADIMRTSASIVLAAFCAATAGAFGATVPQNLAPTSTIISNDLGISGNVFDLQDQEIDGGRFHQGIDPDDPTTPNPIEVAFIRNAPVTISFVRFWNWSDHTVGEFTFKLQSYTGTSTLPADVQNDANWVDIPGTTISYANFPRSDYLSFAPVTTQGLRWVWLKDNNATARGNVRYSEFEFYAEDVNALDWTNSLASATYKDATNTIDLLSGAAPVFDNLIGTRFDGPQVKPGTVTLLWDSEFRPDQVRFYNADMGANRTESFSLSYLRWGGNPDNPADWLPTGFVFTSAGDDAFPQAAWLQVMDLPKLWTRGLRFNIDDPSTAIHEILRLWEIEVFGGLPEPASLSLLAFSGLLLVRKRRA
jgi:hypothetical protein